MKSKIILGFLPLAMIMSCTNDEMVQDHNPYIGSITITSDELVYGDTNNSRVSIDISSGNPIFPFTATDTFGIFPEKGDQVSFPLTDNVGKTSVNFDGGGWDLKSGVTYYAYIPFNRANFATANEKNHIPLSFLGETQSSLNSRTEIEPYVFMASYGVNSENGSLYFQLHHIGALAQISVTIPTAATYSKLYILAESDVFAVKGTVDLEANDLAIHATQWSDRIALNLNNQKFTSSDEGSTYNFWLMIPPSDCSGQTLNIVLVDSFGNTYTSVTREGKSNNFLAGHYYGFTASSFTKESGSVDEGGGNIGFMMESDNMAEESVIVNI